MGARHRIRVQKRVSAVSRKKKFSKFPPGSATILVPKWPFSAIFVGGVLKFKILRLKKILSIQSEDSVLWESGTGAPPTHPSYIFPMILAWRNVTCFSFWK